MGAMRLIVAVGVLHAASQVRAVAPTLYSTAAYQSPVRGDPDDLLLLPGFGFEGTDTVVYKSTDDTTKLIDHPAVPPARSTASLGLADVVSVADAPYSLTIRLPEAMRAGQSYALWVVNAQGEWSNGVKINDARPLWITPDEFFASASLGGLPRAIKVVGRNLQPATTMPTLVRLVGPSATYQLAAEISKSANSAVDRYVAMIKLPDHMGAGGYSVQLSRDGVSWVPLLDGRQESKQKLTILPDPKQAARFPVGRYSFGSCIPGADTCAVLHEPCLPDTHEHQDQTLCIVAAIAAAQAAGGGTVVLGAGKWLMSSAGIWSAGRKLSAKGVSHDGVLIPRGVNLAGSGSKVTTLLRGTGWDIHLPSFALLGHNTVSGVTFRDERSYTNQDSGTALIMLGVPWDRAPSDYGIYANGINHIVISENVFDNPFYAIANGGLSIDHLTVSNNVFGAFRTALRWDGQASNAAYHYRYSDSVVAHNEFFPGSYLDTALGQGTIATELSGGYRTDFSNNTADGTSTAFLHDRKAGAKGWRAAYFWSLGDNAEMLLVSQNAATCTGDKDGDGEAIAYDNNHNRPGFDKLAVPVIVATSNPAAATSTVKVRASLIQVQHSYGTSIDVSPAAGYYRGDWLQVVQGPGIGQARKITDIEAGVDVEGSTLTLTVAPAFDVLPQQNSSVTDSRIFWQTYTIDNMIDHRSPACLKSNRTRHAGGLITLYASTTDSVVEGNTQYDSSGILLEHQFELRDPKAGVEYPGAMVQSFNEIRGNIISGTYDENDETPQAESGLAIAYAATPNTLPPPTISYGNSISHNLISRAASSRGTLSLAPGWFTGPTSKIFHDVTPWKIADATLIFKNALTNAGRTGARAAAIGISARNRTAPIEWRSVMYGNACAGASEKFGGIEDGGTATVRVCSAAAGKSCGCDRQPTDLAVTGVSESNVDPAESTVSYIIDVVNNGPGAATDVVLSAETSNGLAIESMSGPGAACDAMDFNMNFCRLGTIEAGQRVALSVEAVIAGGAPGAATFSLTHAEADTNVKNDSLTIHTMGHKVNGQQPTDPQAH